MTALSTFAYRARISSGEIVSGTMTAESEAEVARKLREDGRTVISVHDRPLQERAELDVGQIRRNEAVKRIKRAEVVSFCEQMGVMLDTGVPLTEALDSYVRQGSSREFNVVLEQVREDVCGGGTLSEATARWPRVFPRIMTSLLRASESSGTLSLMLGRIGEYLSKEQRTARNVRGSLTYPAFMMLAAVGLSCFLLVFVLPRFAAIYEGRNAELPVLTRVLLNTSRAITGGVAIWAPALAVSLIVGFVFVKSDTGRAFLDRLRLTIPGLRGLYRRLYMTRAARTMSTLLQGGVHLLDIISICRDVTGNLYFERMWDDVERGVREGQLMSVVMAESPWIAPNICSMIASGERSGRLARVMEKIADFSEEELDSTIKEVTSFIEPVMVMAMGIIVGGMAIALLLPIFKMSSIVSGSG